MDSAKNPKNIIFEYEMRDYAYFFLLAIRQQKLRWTGFQFESLTK